MSDLEFTLNLEWYADHEVVYNEYRSAEYNETNEEKVLRSSHKDYDLLVFPVKSRGKIIGYAFRYENEVDYYDSFNDDCRYFETEDIARSKAEYELKVEIE